MVVQQITSEQPNLSALYDVGVSGKLRGQGLGYATERLVDALSWKPYWLTNSPTYSSIHRDPGWLDFIEAAALIGALVAVLGAAIRTGRRGLAALAGTTLAMLLGALVAASEYPRNLSVLATYNHRAWWPAGMLVWLTLGWAVATWLLPRLRVPVTPARQTGLPVRRSRALRRPRSGPSALGLALLVLVALLASASSVRGDTVRIRLRCRQLRGAA